jgi:DNA-binding Xre family transcriptional regulator
MLSFISPIDAAALMASRFKSRRLAENFSRTTLADKTGVSEASIKRFETTGEIALVSLLKLAYALDCMHEFDSVCLPKDIISINDVSKKKRARGRG